MIRRYAILTLLLASALAAQTSTATVQGDIRDASGAILPAATVRVTNSATGTFVDTASNAAGHYTVLYLMPGDYQIAVSHPGFQRFHQSGVKLDVGQNLTFDVNLKVGDVSSTIEVTGTPAPLATAQSVVGATTENRAINDLPLNGRVGLELTMLVPGVVPSEGTAGSSIGVADASPYPHSFTPWIAGSRNATSEVLMDGVPLGLPNTNLGTMAMGVSGPTVDAVQEFTVLTSALPAEYGRTGGGVINTASKQGGNKWHGGAYEFVRNSYMDANYFFSNRAGVKRSVFARNHFGGTLGGPVELPRVYDGRNRTFFFFDMERVLARVPSVLTTTVPLASWKNGDFSDLRSASGVFTPIYDPSTARPDAGGTWYRDLFPGNIVPASRTDAVARNLMRYFPSPNTAPTNVYTQANNWTRAGTNRADALDYGIRLDHVITDRWRTFVRLTRGHNNTSPQNFFENEGTPLGRGTQTFVRTAFAWDHTYTINNSTVANIRYGMARMNLHIDPLSYNFLPSSLGFPKYLDAEAAKNDLRFPRFDISGLTSLGQATGAGIAFVPTTHNVLGSVTRMLSRHTVKTGFEYRKLFLNFWQESIPAGQFNFTTTWTQRGPSTATGGNALASVLVGLPNSGTQTNTIYVSTASSYFAGYVQDDFRASRRLVINFGVRYDVDVPRTERFNQQSWWDPAAVSPIAGKVPGYENLYGVMRFADGDARRQGRADKNNIAPRFGIAYRVNDRTSFRAAHAILYAPSQLQAGYKGSEGFRTSTTMTVSTDSRVPLNYLSNPFPYGFNRALGATNGPDSGVNTDLGLAVGESWFPSNDSPVVQQWNATLQRELPGAVLAEVGYLANKGNHLIDGETLNYNQLPASFLPLREKLSNLVANPFAAAITNPNSALSRTTVQYRQLLAAYPQYSAVNLVGAPYGNSIYHSLLLRVERRFSKSVGVRMAYTGGKLIDDSGFGSTLSAGGATTRQDVYNRRLDRAVSSQDVSSRVVLSVNTQLPFGRGHKLLPNAGKVLGAVVGGWQANAIVTLQSGLPVLVSQTLNQTGLGNTSQRPDNNGQSAALGQRSKSDQIAQWFNTGVFSMGRSFEFGTTGRTLPDVRQPGKRNFNLSVFKSFRITERMRATFRVESFNAFNTAQFAAANGQVGNTQFGTISATSVDPRQIQLALKLAF